jgi:pimeloyl-ACP methyl ester carboxylesterase
VLLFTACSTGAPAAGGDGSGVPASSGPAPSAGHPSASGRGPSAAAEPPAQLRRFYEQKVSWRGCGDGFECAKVSVPLDYAQPAQEAIKLSVIRRPAGDRSERIGSLLLNPGGPGASGVDFARQADLVVSRTLRARFDIVGFDPRGVARSAPVECLSDKGLDEFIATDGSPDDAGEEQALVGEARALAAACEKRSGKVLAHVATADAARDMDVLRSMLGDEKLHYLGKSYGTFLGATYAELFPSRVGRLVLDGAIDPKRSSEEINREQAKGFELALDAFIDDCLREHDCPLSGGHAGALAQIDRLLARSDARPLRSDEGRPVTQSLVVLGIVAALYDQDGGWPVLQLALEEAFGGDGSTLLALADYYTDREDDGHYSSNANEAIYAVNCLDRPEQPDLSEVRALSAQYAKVSPRFGPYLAWSSLPCTYWPAGPQGQPHAIHAPGAAPILVVGTLRDPATPYEWAVSLAGQLDSGVLLTWDGDGHTAYRRGSRCVDRAVDNYLVTGTTPTDGTRCD